MTYEKISRPLASDFPPEWYDMNQGNHFWLLWRERALRQMIRDQVLPVDAPLRALDIGCGVGVVRGQIEAITSWEVDGAELNESALKNIISGRGRIMLYNIEDRLEALHEHYDVLVLFDVLEHIVDPEPFLKAALWHLKPGGWVLVNVPAFQALYSRYDELVGHFRRYNRRSMQELLASRGRDLEILDIRYWGFTLVPVAWLRKIALRKSRTPQQAVEAGFQPPAQWINRLFQTVMRVETAVLHHPPCGSSLMALARKH